MRRSPSLDVNYMDLLDLFLTRFWKSTVFPHQMGGVQYMHRECTTYTEDSCSCDVRDVFCILWVSVSLNARYRDEMIDPFSTYHKSKKIRVKTFFLVALCTLKCVEDIFISFFIFWLKKIFIFFFSSKMSTVSLLFGVKWS